MIPWWTIVVGFVAGVILGCLVTAVCAYDTVKNPTRKWWEDV